MNELIKALLDLIRELRPWVIVVPWEQGVRVRLGKWRKELRPGIHLKLPVIDRIFVLPVRRQFVNLPLLDIVAREGAPLTIGLTVGFRITSVNALLNAVSQPEDAISDLVGSFAAKWIRQFQGLDQGALEAAAKADLQECIPGLSEITVAVTTLVTGKRHRLIMDQRWAGWGEKVKME